MMSIHFSRWPQKPRAAAAATRASVSIDCGGGGGGTGGTHPSEGLAVGRPFSELPDSTAGSGGARCEALVLVPPERTRESARGWGLGSADTAQVLVPPERTQLSAAPLERHSS